MQKFIESSLNYIEENLKTDITADELARIANYSVGHFCRLFAQTMGSTVSSYILKRRLDHALIEISSGRTAVSVVLEYGFDTYAGFYKAFVRMYGCSPKKYLSIYKKSEVSIMHSEKDIQSILGNWDVPKGVNVKDVSMRNWKTGEVEWQTWAVGDEYYLKTNERSKMIKNIRIAKALKKEGLSSEFLPILTISGDDYVDGEHIFLLTKKVGELLVNQPLSDAETIQMDYVGSHEKFAFKLGEAVAKLHSALRSVQDDIQPYEASLYNQGLKSMLEVKGYSQKYEMGIGEAFFDDYKKVFGELYDKLPKQLIHGNLTGDSVVYENGEIAGFKGYEIYNVSHVRLFDIVYCAGELSTQQFESYLTTLKNILSGYDSVAPLTVHEKQSVYYVLCSIGMNMLAYCDETLDVSKRNREALSFLAENKEKVFNLL